MILKKWKDIPENLKNSSTEKYYKILSHKKLQLFFKRVMDLIVSIILLIILLPIMLIIAILIKIDSKGPIFYKQERITQYGKTFKIIKFRTMIKNADKKGTLITTKNDVRITKIGKVIRKYRIDEIPQLINILAGDMSFVGTRPEVIKYVEQYTDEMKATLLMPAGVTSIASIKYKNEDEIISKYIKEGKEVNDIYVKKVLPEKMEYNLEYIINFSFFNDIKICINTIIKILGCDKKC